LEQEIPVTMASTQVEDRQHQCGQSQAGLGVVLVLALCRFYLLPSKVN
jgi:hypothetical protein